MASNRSSLRIRSRLIRGSVVGALEAAAWLARHPALNRHAEPLMRRLARITITLRGIGPAASVGAMAEAWQRGFPSKKEVPITEVRDDTAFAEIRTRCPLRGTGDTHACYRMMAYDREIAARAGGHFVVLRSQATPGVEVCQVALRALTRPREDLLDAHRATLQTQAAR